MNPIKIALIRCPQPLLYGSKSGALYSSNRSLTPEPTLPQLHGILNNFSEGNNIPLQVIQVDLRDPANGNIAEICYGEIKLPYLEEPLQKVYSGISLEQVKSVLENADFIGFTSNFAMARKVVCDHIAKVRTWFPDKELWIGGRDIFTSRVEQVYIDSAGGKNLVVFDGHVFFSLPAYLLWKLQKEGMPFGVTVFDNNGNKKFFPQTPLKNFANAEGEIDVPLPIYPRPEVLDYFTGSGEGNPFENRFVHMSLTIGCPNACGYCTTGYRERYLICKDLATIKAEFDYYKQLDVKVIAIMDDNLLCLGVSRVKRIMKLINSYDFLIEYGNGLQLSLLIDHWNELKEPIFQRCVSLYAPLEDLTQDCAYDKLAPLAKELELMENIANAKFSYLRYVTMGVIIGTPGHTRKKLEENFMQNIKNFLQIFKGSHIEVAITIFNFMPLSGTKFGEEALNSRQIAVNDPFLQDPEVCNFGITSYAPQNMTHRDIFILYQQALNLNPAGKCLGVSYWQLQSLGENALPKNQRHKIPLKWCVPGYHLRAVQ